MFAKERKNKINEILHKEGKVVVKDLSASFQVTEDCIRKDLKILEEKGVLDRTYGGGVLVRKTAPNQAIELRKTINVPSKQIISKKAMATINDNETIFLDISSTNILLAEELARSNKKLTVVTNMLDIVTTFRKWDNNIKVICTGGVLSKDLDGFTGSMTIENIANYKPTKCFIGSCGVDILDTCVTTFDVEDGNTKKAIISISKRVFLLMENSKFYIDGTYKFATLHNIDTIITESSPEEEIINLLSKTNTKII